MKAVTQILIPLLLASSFEGSGQGIPGEVSNLVKEYQYDHGGIVRGGLSKKALSLVFTGDEFYEGLERISEILSKTGIRGSFFLTGRLYRNPEAREAILRLKSAGHYLGPHSDMHLLYNDWSKRDSLLVSKDSMLRDLQSNYHAMEALGVSHHKKLFIPPYEWWNREIDQWCREMGVQIINFTPGTGTNADYTYPAMGNAYRSSDTLLQRLYRRELQYGLSGAMILVHIGTDPRRTDKFFEKLPDLIHHLQQRGYKFQRADKLLRKAKPTF